MTIFEVIYAKTIEADDFFDAVDKAKKIDCNEILTVSAIPDEVDDDVYD